MAESDGSRRGRQLGLVAILAVAGAALSAVAAALTWWSADYVDALTGSLTIAAAGSACVPELIPLALVGLAGFGAALATRGVLRRVIGAVIAMCGLAIAVRSAVSFGIQPDALVTELTRPADLVGTAELHPLGPLLGVLGGVMLGAAGVLIVIGLGARQRMGARYDRTDGAAATGETDQGDWWKALDAGGDPTAPEEPDSNPASTARSTTESPPTVSEATSGDGYHDPNASRPS